MSVSSRAPARIAGGRAVPIIVLLPIAASLVLHASTLAEPSVGTQSLNPAEAERAGVAIELVYNRRAPAPMIEVTMPHRDRAPAGSPAPMLLALAADGGTAALVESMGPDPTSLILARGDGSQLRVPMAGVLAADFAPDASWLAAVDGLGSLWRVSADDGQAEQLAQGPFVGPVEVEASGTLLALAVSSVEAPIVSHLVRIDPASGTVTRLSHEELVYGMAPLADGSLAVVAHRPSGTIVAQLSPGGQRNLVDLGPNAVNVSISADGRTLAWESAGEVFIRHASGDVRRLADGNRPRVAPDGSAVLVETGDGQLVVDADGRTVARVAGAAAFVECEECVR